jgi:predicted esterase
MRMARARAISTRFAVRVALVVLAHLVGCRCDRDPAGQRAAETPAVDAPGPAPGPAPGAPDAAPPPPPAPIRVEKVPIPEDLPALLVRGREHRLRMLFLAGMCTHPGGYLQSFQRTAAARGDLIAVQADLACAGDGAMRAWSRDLDLLDRRVDAAFHAADLEPREIVVIGYSQGAERAEELAKRWPDKYVAAILLGSPGVPSTQRLRQMRAVVLMAGTLDAAHRKMHAAVAPLTRAGVPARFISLPGARHGEMGPTPERSMSEALDFVEHPSLGKPD